MEGKRVLWWVAGGAVGGGVFLLVYYFCTYSIVGGDALRGLVLPSVVGALMGGLLADAMRARLARRRLARRDERGDAGDRDEGAV